jgi:GTPase SAR1 family protein
VSILPKLIALYGPDGVGKSTQIEVLSGYLSSRGYRVRRVWLRGPHTLSFLLSRMLIGAGYTRRILNPFGRVKTLPMIGSNSIIKRLWAFTEFISVLPLIFLKVLLPLELGYLILADRYVLDVVVSTAFYIDDPGFVRGTLASILLKLVPRDSVLIHLDTDYETLVARRGDLVEPRIFIDFQKEAYDWLSSRVSTHYIDTSKLTVDETSEAILEIIGYKR